MWTADLPESPERRRAAPVVDGPPRWWWGAVRVVLVLWAVTLLACAAGLAFAGVMGDLGCEKPPASSQYGELGVRVIPVGLECRYGNVGLPDVDGPGAVAFVFQLVLILVPVAAWVLARRLPEDRRRRARREILQLAVVTGILCVLGFALAGLLEGPARVLPPFAVAAAIVTAGLGVALVLVGRQRPVRPTDRS